MAQCHPGHKTNPVCSFIQESAGLSDKLLGLICWGFSLPTPYIPGREGAITASGALGRLGTMSDGVGTRHNSPPEG